MRVPILSYHSYHIDGNDYGDNDLVAFACDLDQIEANGIRIRPVSAIVCDWLSGAPEAAAPTIGLTCDDGSDFDFVDLPHPVAGKQRSMMSILREFRARRPGRQAGLSLTSFVIVSPQARSELDRTCLIGKSWWNDSWWTDAARSGLMEIGNHGWDHNHHTLGPSKFAELKRGTFESIDTEALADFEIAQASGLLRKMVPNPGTSIFAYPYGESNEFLVKDYLPRRANDLGIVAAFNTDPEPVHAHSDRWKLPRYMFRRDWRSPSDLQRILDEARMTA